MVRLTADLVIRSPQCLNPLKERELVLRGNKIPAIENLAVTVDGFDTIDLSDNEIRRLDNFPRLTRLTALFLNNNHLVRIGDMEQVPNVHTLMLTGNKLTNLHELDPLGKMTKLTMLSLIGNPVVRQPQYRLYVIFTIPSLKILDFRKIKAKDRIEAGKMFANYRAKPVNTEEVSVSSRVTESTAKLTSEQQTIIKLAISKAKTNEDVDRLERMLLQGVTPAQLENLKVSVFGGMATKKIITPAPAAPAPAAPIAAPTSTAMEVEESAPAPVVPAPVVPAPVVPAPVVPAPVPVPAPVVAVVKAMPAPVPVPVPVPVAKAAPVPVPEAAKVPAPVSVPKPVPVEPVEEEAPTEDTAMEVEEEAVPAAATDAKTPFDWSKLKVVDLKKEVLSRGLSKEGKKADLVERLTEDDPFKEKS